MEYFSTLKKGNPAICDNIDEPGGQYTNRRTKAAVFHLREELTIVRQLKAKSRRRFARSSGLQSMEIVQWI